MNNLKKISIRISIVGIVVNSFLCAIKLIVGHYSKSVAVFTDGFDNLTDVANSILIFIAYKIASKPADKDHPYGHGRMEDMLSQGISLMIIFVGVTLLVTSVRRIITPETLLQDNRIIIMLIVSILIKLALAYYYRRIYSSTKLISIKAQVSDSVSDVLRNMVIVIGYLITFYTDINLDGYLGAAVSLLIIYNGVKLFSETSSIMLGRSGNEQLIRQIDEILKGNSNVLGVHDLRIHSYGLDTNYASGDVEIDGNLSFMVAHDLLDTLEEEIKDKTGVIITLHGDPVSDDKDIRQLRKIIRKTTDLYDGFSYHDLHYNKNLGCYHVDLSIPYAYDLEKNDPLTQIKKQVHEYNKDIQIQINIDRH